MIKRALALILISVCPLLLITRESIGQTNEEIIISAAISLTNTFEEIGKNFQGKHKNVRLFSNFGGSGALARQIIGGAPTMFLLRKPQGYG
jgi:molybdate transport system substrate-binding protein